jgi:nitroreductase
MEPDAAALLRTRRSVALMDLRDPAPDAAALERLLTVAMRVPDHGKLVPWRIRVIRGEAKARLAAVIEAAYREEVAVQDPARLAKLRAMPNNAPLLLAVSSRLTRDHKVPESEQLLSGGALCQNILLSAHAEGFGAFWMTGWAAYSPGVKRALDVASGEQILGFIAIGSVGRPPGERPRPAYGDVVSAWQG